MIPDTPASTQVAEPEPKPAPKQAKRRGRPPKRRPQPQKVEAKAEEAPKPKPKPPEKFTFKSKYVDDRVRLKPLTREILPDGSTKTTPFEYAEFHQNTWSTTDPQQAERMREVLRDAERRRARVVIVETTNLDGG